MTNLTMNSRDRNNCVQSALLVAAFIALAWSVIITHLLDLTSGVSLSRAGPGMELFAAAKAYLLNDPFALDNSIGICGAADMILSPASFAQCMAMWFAMVAAMMFPTLMPFLWRLQTLTPWRTLAFLVGYMAGWLPFSLLVTILHFTLSTTGLVNGYMISASGPLTALIILLCLYYIVKNKYDFTISQIPQFNVVNGFIKSGMQQGYYASLYCWPHMIIMFAFGVMNALAMIVMTLIYFLQYYPRNVSRNCRRNN